MSPICRKMIFGQRLRQISPYRPEEDLEKPVKEQSIKSHALKKMAELFRRWKNELKASFVDQEKTPEFTGQYEKIRDH